MSPGRPASAWIARPAGKSEAETILFCFAHAGGGASTFWPWRELLLPEIEVASIVLPGRERRFGEAPCSRLEDLLDPLLESLRAAADRPFALFGHSLGAILAYEVARRWRAVHGDGPLHLFVSGRRAPHLPARRGPIHELPEDEFLEAVYSLNGTPPEVSREPALIERFVPCLRADFELNDTYAPRPGPPLSCPVTAFVGHQDPEVQPREIVPWESTTSGEFRWRIFAGDHFYLNRARSELVETIRSEILKMSKGSRFRKPWST